MVGLSTLITKRPVTIILIILLLTTYFGANIKSIKTSGDPMLYLPDNEDADVYRETINKYGNAQYGIAMIDAKNGDVLTRNVFLDTLKMEWELENNSNIAPYFAQPGKPGNVMGIVDGMGALIGALTDKREITRQQMYDNMTQPWSPWVEQFNFWFSTLKSMGYMDEWENVTYFDDSCIKASIFLISSVAPRLKDEQGIDLKVPPEILAFLEKSLTNDFDPHVTSFTQIKASGMALMVALNKSIGTDKLIDVDTHIQDIVESGNYPSFSVNYFSLKLITRDVNRSSEESLNFLLPLAVLIITVILLLSFRNILDTIIALMALVMALIWMYGIANLLNLTLTTICMAAPILLVGLGIDYAIHIIKYYKEELLNGYRVKDATIRTMSSIGVAILLSTITTIVGFLSNMFSDLNAIADFGILCALGIVSSFIISNTFIPSVKYLIDSFKEKKGWQVTPKKKKEEKIEKDDKKYHDKLRVFTIGAVAANKMPGTVVTAAIVLSLITAYLATNIGFDFDSSEFLPDDAPIKKVMERMTTDYSISTRYVTVVIRGDAADPDMLLSINQSVANMADDTYVQKPNNVPQVSSIVSTMKEYYASTGSQGFKDIYKGTDTLENDLIPDYHINIIYQWMYEDPDERPTLKTHLDCDNIRDNIIGTFLHSYARRTDVNVTYKKYWDELGGVLPDNWMENKTVNLMISAIAYNESAMNILSSYIDEVSGPFETNVMTVFVNKPKTSETYKLKNELWEDFSDTNRPDILPLKDIAKKIQITGGPIVDDSVQTAIRNNQAVSIGMMIIVSLIILSIVFGRTTGSIALGIITTLPVIMVVAWIMGTLYLLGYTINVMTTMISALTIGLGIDYSIHVSHGFVEHLSVVRDRYKAINITTQTIGSALLGASTTTIGGFVILMLSPLPPLRDFGFLTALTIAFSIIAALYVLPSMLVLWAKGKEDRYSVDESGLKYMEYQCTSCKRPFVLKMADKKYDVKCPYCGSKARFKEIINIKQLENSVSPKLYVASYSCPQCSENFQVKTIAIKETMTCPKCGAQAHLMKDQYGRPLTYLQNPTIPTMNLSYAVPAYYPQQYYYTNEIAYYNQMQQYINSYGGYYNMQYNRRIQK